MADFAYWYITIVLIALGAGGLVFSRYMSDLKLNFRYELRDPAIGERLRAILDRRRVLEGVGSRPILFASISYLAFGLLCAARVVTPAVAYALACADSAIVLALVFARVRNRSERRAAALAPRRQTNVVPPLGYMGAFVAAAIPLMLISDVQLRVPAIVVAISSLAVLAAAWWTAGMAAVLVGDDVDLEVYVDERLRRVRVCAMLALSYAIGPVFIAVVTPDALNLPMYPYAIVLSLALIAAFLAWYSIDYLRGRMPRTHDV